MILLKFLLPICLSVRLLAGLSAGPRTWTAISEDNSRILVNLSAATVEVPADRNTVSLPDGRKLTIKEQFSTSGVYSLPNLELLWSFPWKSTYKSDIAWSPDFSRLAVWYIKDFELKKENPWGLHILHEERSVKFYEEDELYLRFSKWYYFAHKIQVGGPDYSTLDVLDDKLTLNTARRGSPSPLGWRDIGYWETYTFDLETGRILSVKIHDGKTKVIISAVLSIFALVFVGIIVTLIWIIKRSKTPKDKKYFLA